MRAVATEFLRLRPAIVIPFLAMTVIVLAATGSPKPQVVALAFAASIFAGFFLHERRVGRRKIVDARTLFRSLVMTAIGITAAVTATGALASPLLPMLFAPIGVGFAAFGRERRGVLLLALLVVIVAFAAVVTPAVAGLVLTEGARKVILAAAILDAALLLWTGVASLSAAHRRAADTLAIAGDEMVRAAQARTRSLEALGAKVAHEVKNPLAAIRALVEVMLEAGDERAKRRLSVAASEIARIERILESYGSHAHPLEVVHRAPADVTELVSALAAVLEARAARKGVVLGIEGRDQPLVFTLDRDRVKEALLNLVLNALDATDAGGRVTVAYDIAADGALELRVSDTGKGMDAATLAKLGTPFFTQREGGTGLGVALARQVAEQHGGALLYESMPGAGTTATMRILLASAGASATTT